MSLRPYILATWVIVLAVVSTIGVDVDGLAGRGPNQALAAPDNSIALVPFVTGLSLPIFVTHAGDRTGRMFIVEQGGKIKVVVNGKVLPTPFLDLTDIVSNGGESGALGLAFHPKFATNGRFFVYYTAKPPSGSTTTVGDNTLAEYRANPLNPNVALPTPVRTLFALADRAVNHNGGTIAFSPVDTNPYIYVGLGDEGGGGDSFGNAQNPATLFGKILRLDVDSYLEALPYAIPPTNPYASSGPFRPEVWAYGFRNPYRFSFDRQTGDLFIGDVGQNLWEEIDVMPSLLAGQAGRNYGWNIREGTHCFSSPSCPSSGLVDPILEYDHNFGCSVTGGYRYRGTAHPPLQGIYFYGDYCSGRIWKGILNGSTWTAVEALDTTLNITAFGEDEAGELYVVDHLGTIFRLAHATQVPTATPTPVPCATANRPPVVVQSTPSGPGRLQVVVGSTTNSTTTVNQLQSIAFTRVDNALVTIGNQVDRQAPFSVTLAAGTPSTQFTVRRKTPGQAMHVDLSITDNCGPWTTFVGAGPQAP